MKMAFLYHNEAELVALRAHTQAGDAFLCSEFTSEMAAQFTHIACVNTQRNNAFLASLGAQINRQPIMNVMRVIDEQHFLQPAYSGTIQRIVSSKNYPVLLSIDVPVSAGTESRNLHDADIVVGGGKGLQNAENFKMVDELADALNGASGATLDAIQAGWAAPDKQIGQTGTSIAPRLYLACGISGAAHHVAGIRRAKTVIAINKNPNAAIFQHADYGFVGDALDILPYLIARFKS